MVSITDHRSHSGIRIVTGTAQGGQHVRNELVEQFDPLVRYIVDRHRDRVVAPGALLTAGRNALRDLVMSTHLKPHSREFLAHAVRAILQAVRQEIARQGLQPAATVAPTVRRAAGEWEHVHGRSPAVSELADLLALSPNRILTELDYH